MCAILPKSSQCVKLTSDRFTISDTVSMEELTLSALLWKILSLFNVSMCVNNQYT